ncbi:hypothetical protein KP79_PYT19099 [Mizuhopecten yessoensis]|uniref:Uncharacterized protein n=1 Tax=Mizuhopecten yessoensis TaxID=6573 RepID=A0A210PT54_MIZYE|nr:hypothetical protein KP79_PYT19099 [Mizuhopecten yessoensis]
MAKQCSDKLPPNSVIVLMARNKEALESVKCEVSSVALDINIVMRQYDQGNAENGDYFKDIFNDLLLENIISQNDFKQFMIVHNCATLCGVTKISLELLTPRQSGSTSTST